MGVGRNGERKVLLGGHGTHRPVIYWGKRAGENARGKTQQRKCAL